MFDEKWECADGRLVSVHEMTTSHLMYSIARIRRLRHWRRHWLPRLEAELSYRMMSTRDQLR